jgi:ribosomal protein L37AE/L43A
MFIKILCPICNSNNIEEISKNMMRCSECLASFDRNGEIIKDE